MCGLVYITTSDSLRVTAEVKHNPTSTIVCKAQGEWNGTLEFTYSSGETKVIDTAKLAVTRKRLRPVERQGRTESRSDTPGLRTPPRTPPRTPGWPTHPTDFFFFRRLWQHVTKALKDGNIDEATGHKHRLEERQRAEEKQRAADNKPWTPKYFTKEVKLQKKQNKNNFSLLIVPHSPPAHSSALETPLGLYASEERPKKSRDIREWDTAEKISCSHLSAAGVENSPLSF